MKTPCWFDPTKPDELTPEDRDWVVDQVLSTYQDRWVERQIAVADDYAEALAFCLRHVSNGYRGCKDYRMEMLHSGVYGEIYGRQGKISWREIIDHVRKPARQLALF